MKKLILSLAMIGLASSCSKNEVKQQVETIGTNDAKALEVAGKNSEAADMYTRIGELLLQSEAFVLADNMFSKALALNPKHNKALFYSAVTGVIKTTEGIGDRVDQIDRRLIPDIEHEIAKTKRQLEGYPELKGFIFNKGKGKIRTLNDIAKFGSDEVVKSFEKGVETLSKIDGDVELLIGVDKFKGDSLHTTCYYDSYDMYSNVWCDYRVVRESQPFPKAVKHIVDKEDIKVLKGSFRAYATAITLYTSYSLEGAFDLQQEIEALNRRGNPSAEKIIKTIKKYKKLGKLQSNNLQKINANLTQTLEDALDLASLRRDLCQGSSRANNLFKHICVPFESIKDIESALEYLSGPKKHLLGTNRYGKEVYVRVDATAILDNPIKDLKDQLPVDFDANGNVTDIVDQTVGGLFPDADIIQKLRELNDEE